MGSRLCPGILCLAAFLAFCSPVLEGQQVHVTRLSTPAGVQFGIIGQKAAAPAPTLLIFASSMEESLESRDFNRTGLAIQRTKGFLLVSLDLPCHGADRKQDEPKGLSGWCFRLRHGENFVPGFLAKVSSVIDYLISQGYTDAQRIGVSGTSRGGFAALQFAAFDSRIKWVAAFAPVTNLLALREFEDMWSNALTRSLALLHVAPGLTNRAIWICIGNLDDRVGTDNAIAFGRRIVEAALAQGKFPDLTFELQPTVDHAILPNSYEKAAEWLNDRVEKAYRPPR